jgi:hypothetical protein
MCEGFIVPKCRVLENKPSTRLAKPAPSLAFVAVASDPAWSIHIARKAKILLVGHEVWVLRLHVGFRGIRGLLVQRRVQIWRLRHVGKM